MQIYIAGTGKLAAELVEGLTPNNGLSISRWPVEADLNTRCIVVHAGSGREVGSISSFCERTSSVLVELATGSSLEGSQPNFPLVLCPNTNILMLKFMCMLERSGSMFKGSEIRITESHQASKTSVPGTAVSIATALGIPASEIVSVRDISQQATDLNIPQAHLGRHAFHRMNIRDGPCTISIETRVFGESPYASGVQKIVNAIQQRKLQSRVYLINEFIESGWV
jgi:4-hydroxy-tetrahydrodipicolinate reductase